MAGKSIILPSSILLFSHVPPPQWLIHSSDPAAAIGTMHALQRRQLTPCGSDTISSATAKMLHAYHWPGGLSAWGIKPSTCSTCHCVLVQTGANINLIKVATCSSHSLTTPARSLHCGGQRLNGDRDRGLGVSDAPYEKEMAMKHFNTNKIGRRLENTPGRQLRGDGTKEGNKGNIVFGLTLYSSK